MAAHPTSPLSFCQRCSLSQCARRWCTPHRCRRVTSPVLRKCWSVRFGADVASARWRIVLDQPSPAARPGYRAVRDSCGTRPLRPPASLLHNAALPSVPASRYAKAPLGAGHRFAPYWVKATGVMQSGLRWSRSHSRRRFPVVGTPYAPPSARRVAGQWPAASHLVCAPPTLWPRRCAALALRWSARPPPRGSLSPAPGVTPPNGGGSKTSNLWCKSMYLRRYSAGMEHPRKNPAIF